MIVLYENKIILGFPEGCDGGNSTNKRKLLAEPK